jgi:putative Ca2+/H+ antiporter (TMEM165/GDT1 family)
MIVVKILVLTGVAAIIAGVWFSDDLELGTKISLSGLYLLIFSVLMYCFIDE